MSKYGNKKTYVDGIKFDSKKEANRYIELKTLLLAGKITGLELQKSYDLIPAQYLNINGKRKCIERPIKYVADFVYQQDGVTVVEDVKGKKTPAYIIKRKLMLWVNGIKISEV